MRPKVLFCATKDVHFKAFHMPYLQWFAERGWEVHIAADGQLDIPCVHRKYSIPIRRSPFHRDNMTAYAALGKIISSNRYALIHCHTPMGGVLARLAARKARKYGTKVIYTAHGFHFCQDTSIFNWLFYYPVEKWLAHYTDCLITINEEDYLLAVRKRFAARRIERVHGVGVDTEKYRPASIWDYIHLRRHYGYGLKHFLMFGTAEFNRNKNQQMLIRALALMKDEAPHARLLLAGDGPLTGECRELARECGVAPMVDFLGYREDIAHLLPMCDVAVSASRREGLPVNIMEAMACGLPVVATQNRGHNELIADKVNGYLVPPGDIPLFAKRLLALSRSKGICLGMGAESTKRIRLFSLEAAGRELMQIYADYDLDDDAETEGVTARTPYLRQEEPGGLGETI